MRIFIILSFIIFALAQNNCPVVQNLGYCTILNGLQTPCVGNGTDDMAIQFVSERIDGQSVPPSPECRAAARDFACLIPNSFCFCKDGVNQDKAMVCRSVCNSFEQKCFGGPGFCANVYGSYLSDGADCIPNNYKPQKSCSNFDTDSYPEIFKYTKEVNANLNFAICSISKEFKAKGVTVTDKLLAAILATLKKETESIKFLPREEIGDFGMGPGCSYPSPQTGNCRGSPYDGGIDFKGRGYIMLTGKGNYKAFCGDDCVGTSSPGSNVCGCKNVKRCTVKDPAKCPQIKAMDVNGAGRMFAAFYIGNKIVDLCNSADFVNAAYQINKDPKYDADFDKIAREFLGIFASNARLSSSYLSLVNSQDDIQEVSSAARIQITLLLILLVIMI